MDKFSLHFAISGVVRENPETETAEILRKMADKIEEQGMPMEVIVYRIFDSNGNRIGYASVERGDED